MCSFCTPASRLSRLACTHTLLLHVCFRPNSRARRLSSAQCTTLSHTGRHTRLARSCPAVHTPALSVTRAPCPSKSHAPTPAQSLAEPRCPARPFHGGEAEAVRGGGAGTAAAGLTFMSGGRLTPLTRPEDAPARRKSRPRAASPRQLPRRRAQHAGPWAGPGGLGAWPRAGPVRAGHEACVGVGGAAVSGWGQ